MPVKFQGDSTILKIHRTASRLYEIFLYDVLCDSETDPWKLHGAKQTFGLETKIKDVEFFDWPQSCSEQLYS